MLLEVTDQIFLMKALLSLNQPPSESFPLSTIFPTIPLLKWSPPLRRVTKVPRAQICPLLCLCNSSKVSGIAVV